MTLLQILVFTAFALAAGFLLPRSWRPWLVLGGSLVAIYWLQSSTPIRNLDFWFPTASIGLTVFVWIVTQPDQSRKIRASATTSVFILGMIVAIGLTRYIEPLCCLTPTRPPDLMKLTVALSLGSIAVAVPARLLPRSRFLTGVAILLILALFIVLKTEGLARPASAWLHYLSGQSADLASPLDLRWLGFSYLAFRLLHTLRDHQTGKLPAYSLGEFVTYAIFFPAYPAGPIDRSQHFIQELRHLEPPKAGSPEAPPAKDIASLLWGCQRILWGVFKKFVLADSLALIALNGQNAAQAASTPWVWVLLYAYTLRIYFDFSGYIDIALGLGRLLGFSLPENFDQPYLKQNLTAFWNSWHITLAQWFRAYFFNPLTRALRQKPQRLPVWAIILVGQLGTMLLIGLWHGFTWNFAIWGIWHGLGLFVHNRWSDWVRPRMAAVDMRPNVRRALQIGGWFLTFHYVTLGWVWFALPDPGLAASLFQKLAGI